MQKKLTASHQKADLISALHELLRYKKVGTQDEIKLHLEKKGFLVNQVKISRLLHKVGAIKMTEENQIVYRLPAEMVSISPNDSLKQLILNIDHNDSTVVIQTAPGCAQFVARFLDMKKDLGILGTVAGDDTIFCAVEKNKKSEKVAKIIYTTLLG